MSVDGKSASVDPGPPKALQRPLPLDFQLLWALSDLKTERLLAEAELVVTYYANIEAQLAAAEDRSDLAGSAN